MRAYRTVLGVALGLSALAGGARAQEVPEPVKPLLGAWKQAETEKGRLFVGPLEDRRRVDEFRKEIGLPPLAEYLKRYKEENGGRDVEVVDD